MTDYLTEQEQLEILKNWIKQYSAVIIAGIAVAVLLTTGFRYWQQRQERILNHASAVYDEMINLRVQNNNSAALVQANKILKHYPKLVYGQMAALMIARDAIAKENYVEAQKQYEWVIEHSYVPALRQIARLRLARLFIAEKNPTEALKTLEKTEDKTFQGLIEEVKGDAFLAMNDLNKAHDFYQQAITNLPNAEIVRPLLQMKYDNLNKN